MIFTIVFLVSCVVIFYIIYKIKNFYKGISSIINTDGSGIGTNSCNDTTDPRHIIPGSLEKVVKCPYYTKSKYYDETSFPMNVVLIETKFRITDDLEILTKCCTEINKCLDYNVFNTDIRVVRDKDYVRRKNDLLVNIFNYEHLDHEAFDGEGSILAHATLPPYRFLCIDASEKWTDEKLICTLLHELGHILGMVHTTSTTSIMYVRLNYLQTYTSFDIANVYKIYPFMMEGNKTTTTTTTNKLAAITTNQKKNRVRRRRAAAASH